MPENENPPAMRVDFGCFWRAIRESSLRGYILYARDLPYGAPCATLGFRRYTACVILSVVELLWLATKARGKAEVGSRADGKVVPALWGTPFLGAVLHFYLSATGNSTCFCGLPKIGVPSSRKVMGAIQTDLPLHPVPATRLA